MGRKKRNLPQLAKRSKVLVDTNAIMIDPSQPHVPLESIFTEYVPDLSAASSKKKKRLEKFIDTRLRKEERIQMLRDLSSSCLQSNLMISTKYSSKKLSKAEKQAKNALEKQAGIQKTFAEIDSEVEEETETSDSEEEKEVEIDQDPINSVEFSRLSSSDEEVAEDSPSVRDYFDETAVEAVVRPTTTKAFPQRPSREPEIQAQRSALPVFAKEQEIVEMINAHPVTILCGETGSGKTTQIPQFLFEYGYSNAEGEMPGMIGITQPRRVAAVSMAQRVSQELNYFVKGPREQMGDSLSSNSQIGQSHNSISVVSHQIRYDSSVHPGTAIKFMTDGVLLKEVAVDFLLSRYSAIIVDEAHERNLNTDLLIGLLSRISTLREEMWRQKEHFPGKPSFAVYPLKLVIMSATLRVGDFTANPVLFPITPPVLTVEGKCFNVNVHFSKTTPEDYLKAAYQKACFVHNSMPAGGILIFCTGKNEIKALCKKLREKFGASGEGLQESEKSERKKLFGGSNSNKPISSNSTSHPYPISHTEHESFSCSDWEQHSTDQEITDDETVQCKSNQPLFVVPLFSMLSPEAQMKAFQKPPADSRLVVIATNVAETSITIPNIKYVIDCGKVKEKHWDRRTQIQSFSVNWISKSSAEQRCGRAGRTAEGHCYRLYSSAVFEREFPQHSLPEIQRIPVDSITLTMKAMHIDRVVNFPFPSPPDRAALKASEDCLKMLGALEQADGMITALGRQMALFPLAPRVSRILVEAINRVSSLGTDKLTVLLVVLCCIAVGSAEFWILEDSWDELAATEASHSDKKKAYHETLRAFGFYSVRCDHYLPAIAFIDWTMKGKKGTFCTDNFIRQKTIQEIDMLLNQLCSIIHREFGIELQQCKNSLNLSHVQTLLDNQSLFANLLMSGYGADQVVYLASTRDKKHIYAKVSAMDRGGTASALKEAENQLFVHPSSVFWPAKIKPKHLMYTELQRSLAGVVRMRGVCEIRIA